MRLFSTCHIAAWLLASPLLVSNLVGANGTQPATTYALNGYKRVLDGQWEGIRYASDGNVYFASSTHSVQHGAAFFKFDPRTNILTMLVEDITTICKAGDPLCVPEDPKTNPQGKVHSDIVEANGWLYFSTHFSAETPDNRYYTNWTGAHVIGYNMATGTFKDYGVVHPNYTSYAGIAVDGLRKYLYVFVTGEKPGQVSYVYRINTDTGQKLLLGQVGGTFGTSLWFFIDKRGDVWFSLYFDNGSLRRIRASDGGLDYYPNVLPPVVDWNDPNKSTADPARSFAWLKALDGDRAVFTLGFYGGALYEFNSTKPIGNLPGQSFRKLAFIGYTDLGLAVGNNRVFYYQVASNAVRAHQDRTDFHLMSVSLNPGDNYKITDYGLLKDASGRLLWRAPGMATDGNSRVFMIGDWWTVNGDLGSCKYFDGISDVCGGLSSYRQLDRGEFFAVANVGAAATGYGDTNLDGRFDMADLNSLVDHLLQRKVIGAGSAAFYNSDVDGDGALGMADLNNYVDCLLQRIDSFPVQPGTGFCRNASGLGQPVVSNSSVAMTKPLAAQSNPAAKALTLTGTFRNTTGAALVKASFKVTLLRGAACPCTVVGYGGEGATIPLSAGPLILPGQTFTQSFTLQVTQMGVPVSFYVDFVKY